MFPLPPVPSRDLPIFELESALVASLRAHSRLVLQAPTGSGKSTQVPQIILDHGLAGDGEIVVLQPRRLATRMLAARVAQERNGRLGDEVGYQIRLDRVCSTKTRIRFVTEGVLLRQMLADPRLRGISVIVFDEFHERHLFGDITLARALDLQEEQRADLKLVVMSATLDAGTLQKYLAPCDLLTSGGRTFPVEIEYLEKPLGDGPVWDAAAEAFERAAREGEGDALVFMPGAYEIQRTIQAIRHTRAGTQCVVLPLHGDLPVADQDAAVARYEKRKVIVSTNVAETSLTIDGVRIVIDGGLARMARFDPYRGINTLLVERISRASADQRAGRAGRTAPGRCLRLWTEREHSDRPAQELPEVKRLDLAEVVLTLKASGVEDVARFRWLEAPDPRSLERALTLLTDLGALSVGQTCSLPDLVPASELASPPEPSSALSGQMASRPHLITPLGRRMLAFPAHPRYARMLLAAHELGCVPAAALIAALTQGRNLLRRAEGKQMQDDRETRLGENAESDFFTLMRAQRFAEQRHFNPQDCRPLGINAAAAREAAALADQFLKIARDERLSIESRETSGEALQRCILAGFPDMVALRLDSGTLRCALVHGRKGVLARESVVSAPLLVASEVREVQMRGELETLLTLATAIREEWLRELFPEGFAETSEVFFDASLRRVLARRQTRFHDLVLRAEQTDKVPHEQAAALLAREVEAGRCPLKHWDHTVDQWILRLNQVTEWHPEFELPKLGEEARRMLLEQICFGATSYKEIKERPVWPTVKGWLSAAQQDLIEKYAPERLELPNGRRAKIIYDGKAAPTIAARIQDLYGVTGELRIGGNRIPLVIQVLAPNHRPIQITQNLATFWKDSYPKIKQELQRKYPKHEWR
ncbi:MAG: ATP-dependent helicase HrpB [Chthoniobacter sp.]|jgi:ATP-dependent helicase HrpB|nr:ATP-dependent helicase HrpB [Chthoniobacter sp.]